MSRQLDSNGAAGDGSGTGLTATLSRWFLKPAGPGGARPSPKDRTVDDLEREHRQADDRERFIGLMAAPIGAAIALLVVGVQVAHDPAVGVKGHVNPSLYHELLVVLLALSVLMLVAAWFRKRMYLGVAAALYGLAVFNLHFWGFGVPFVMVGAWLLLRAYRAQRDYREATGALPARSGGQGGRRRSGSSAPTASRRYTPPAARRRGTPTPSRGSSGRKAS